MLSLFLVILAAILNSMMDTTTHHFSTSIFKNLEPKFWNPNISWEYAKTILGYKCDFWHICKTLMLFCLMAAIILYKPITTHPLLDWAILGSSWNIFFNVMYNKILK
jgi:hypothetical protein